MATCDLLEDIKKNAKAHGIELTSEQITEAQKYIDAVNQSTTDNMVSKQLAKKNYFTVKPIKSVDNKAIVKASIATQFIGYGLNGSSTALYANQAGKYANTGKYTKDDVVFISINGKNGKLKDRKAMQDKTIKLAFKAIKSGATLITDTKGYVAKSKYNEGEQRLAKNLEYFGYTYSEQVIDGTPVGAWSNQKALESNYNTSTINTLSKELLQNNKDKIYVFGDNSFSKGNGGQAVIRDEPNAFGIPTKKLPSNTGNAYYNDSESGLVYAKKEMDVAIDKLTKLRDEGKEIVFPKDGLGTGRAKLKEKSPRAFEYLNKRLLEEFGFDNVKGKTVKSEKRNVLESNTNTEQTLKSFSNGKTASPNVKIVKDIFANKNNKNVITAYRVDKKKGLLQSFKDHNAIGNPFDWKKYGAKEATKMFHDWLTSDKYDKKDTFNYYAYINKGKRVTVDWGNRGKFEATITGNLEYNGDRVDIEVRTNKGNVWTANPFHEITGKDLIWLPKTAGPEANIRDEMFEYKQALLEAFNDGSLKGKTIEYYKELGYPSHATVIDYLVNGNKIVQQKNEEPTDRVEVVNGLTLNELKQFLEYVISPKDHKKPITSKESVDSIRTRIENDTSLSEDERNKMLSDIFKLGEVDDDISLVLPQHLINKLNTIAGIDGVKTVKNTKLTDKQLEQFTEAVNEFKNNPLYGYEKDVGESSNMEEQNDKNSVEETNDNKNNDTLLSEIKNYNPKDINKASNQKQIDFTKALDKFINNEDQIDYELLAVFNDIGGKHATKTAIELRRLNLHKKSGSNDDFKTELTFEADAITSGFGHLSLQSGSQDFDIMEKTGIMSKKKYDERTIYTKKLLAHKHGVQESDIEMSMPALIEAGAYHYDLVQDGNTQFDQYGEVFLDVYTTMGLSFNDLGSPQNPDTDIIKANEARQKGNNKLASKLENNAKKKELANEVVASSAGSKGAVRKLFKDPVMTYFYNRSLASITNGLSSNVINGLFLKNILEPNSFGRRTLESLKFPMTLEKYMSNPNNYDFEPLLALYPELADKYTSVDNVINKRLLMNDPLVNKAKYLKVNNVVQNHINEIGRLAYLKNMTRVFEEKFPDINKYRKDLQRMAATKFSLFKVILESKINDFKKQNGIDPSKAEVEDILRDMEKSGISFTLNMFDGSIQPFMKKDSGSKASGLSGSTGIDMNSKGIENEFASAQPDEFVANSLAYPTTSIHSLDGDTILEAIKNNDWTSIYDAVIIGAMEKALNEVTDTYNTTFVDTNHKNRIQAKTLEDIDRQLQYIKDNNLEDLLKENFNIIDFGVNKSAENLEYIKTNKPLSFYTYLRKTKSVEEVKNERGNPISIFVGKKIGNNDMVIIENKINNKTVRRIELARNSGGSYDAIVYEANWSMSARKIQNLGGVALRKFSIKNIKTVNPKINVEELHAEITGKMKEIEPIKDYPNGISDNGIDLSQLSSEPTIKRDLSIFKAIKNKDFSLSDATSTLLIPSNVKTREESHNDMIKNGPLMINHMALTGSVFTEVDNTNNINNDTPILSNYDLYHRIFRYTEVQARKYMIKKWNGKEVELTHDDGSASKIKLSPVFFKKTNNEINISYKRQLMKNAEIRQDLYDLGYSFFKDKDNKPVFKESERYRPKKQQFQYNESHIDKSSFIITTNENYVDSMANIDSMQEISDQDYNELMNIANIINQKDC